MRTSQTLAPVAATLLAFAVVIPSRAQAPRSISVEPHSPSIVAPGGMGYFPITVTRAGSGSLSLYLTVTIENVQDSTSVAFIPPEVSFSDQGPSTKNAVLVVRTTTSTPKGEYKVTVSARHGSSPSLLSCTSVLKVGSDPIIIQQPVLDIPVVQPDGTIALSGSGTPSQPVLVQATTNLASATSWETIAVQTMDERGLLSLVDQDSTNYPARFYRLAQ